MAHPRPGELLYDSEATLRLIDRALNELCVSETEHEPDLGDSHGSVLLEHGDLRADLLALARMLEELEK